MGIKSRYFFFASFIAFSAPLFAAQALVNPTASAGTSTDTFRPPIYFEADSLQYSEESQIITATGNVKVQQSSYTFLSDLAQFNLPEKTLNAWGHVRFKDLLNNEVNSNSINYNTERGNAQLLSAEGRFQEWLFAAEKVERDDNGDYLLERARLSTCEKDLTKYHVYGRRIRVKPGKRLTVEHAVFRLGPVPILYFPYYYYSLGEKHLAFQIFPGQSQSEGPFVRTVWGYATTDETYVKVFLDELTKKGLGTGGEYDYYYGDRLKGSLYGYRIHDQQSNEERWNVRLQHWQRLGPDAILQANGNKLSDDTFPNDFFREDFNRVVRDFTSSTAFTYQKSNNYFRIVGSQTDLFDVNNKNFFTDDAVAPRLEWNQVQTSMGFLGLERIISANYSNHFAGKSFYGDILNRRYRQESDAQMTLLRKFNLIPLWTTFVPKATIRNLWTDRPQGSEQTQATQKITTEETLRQRFGYDFDIDMTHSLTQRLQNNGGPDQGLESHFLSLFSLIRMGGDLLSLRLQATHNLPKARNEPLALLEGKNYNPLSAEILMDPADNVEFFFREQYILSDPNTGSMHPLTTQSELNLGRKYLGEDYYTIGTSYSSERDDHFEIRQTARWTPSRTVKLEATLRTTLFYKNNTVFSANRAELTEKAIAVKKEWRCWILSLSFTERTGVTEFLFNLELKLDREEKQKEKNVERESEFYPWRDPTVR